MKKLFTILAVAAAVVACQKNETIALDNGEAIAFGNAFVENSTRAAFDPSYNATNLTAFNVYGTVNGGEGLVAIYSGANVEGTVGSTIVDGKETQIWHCDVKQYWIKDAVYNFAALVNATNDIDYVDYLPTKVKGFTADGNKDLLYARSEANIVGLASGNTPVNFTFDHLLSKVKFTVVNDSKEAVEYSFKVNGITITGNKTGNVTLATKEWDTLSNSGAYNVDEIVVDKDTADAGEECATELLLIPGKFAIAFNVDIYNGTTKLGSQSYPIAPATYNYTLAAGCSYNFQINVAEGEEITFSVTEAPAWADGDGNDDTVLQ